MKIRVKITGNLTKDAENIVGNNKKNFCRFTVAVNYKKEANPFFVDCLLNTHLADDKLQLFTKGTLCTFVGRYKESANEKEGKYYLNRTLYISDFYTSKIKNPFYRNMSVILVGYLLDKPKEDNGQTTFVLMEKPYSVYGVENNKRYICKLNYTLSDKAKEKLNEEDTSIFVYGYYDEDITPSFKSLYIDRYIEVKDFEILDRPIQNIKIGNLRR